MKLPCDTIRKIGIIRVLQLGEMLCSIPAIRSLRLAYPKAEIVLFGLPWSRSFAERFSMYFNRFKWFPGFEGMPEQSVEKLAVDQFIKEVSDEKFDLIIQMQGNGTFINELMPKLGSRFTAGFFLAGDLCPDCDLYLTYPGKVHEIERHLALMDFLGTPSTGVQLEFPIHANDEDEFVTRKFPIRPKEYVCIHPGSKGSWGRWPTKYFAAIGDYCAAHGKQVLITGTKEDLAIVETVWVQMNEDALMVAGQTSLGAIAVLLRDAFALVSNCTGVSHIAAALQTPSVVISMDGQPGRWAPLNKQLHKTIDWTVTPFFDDVLNHVKSLFQQPPGVASEELVA